VKQPQRYYDALFHGLIPVTDTRREDDHTVSGVVQKTVKAYKAGERVTFLARDLVVKTGVNSSGFITVMTVGPEA
jgi:hypothetical protein